MAYTTATETSRSDFPDLLPKLENLDRKIFKSWGWGLVKEEKSQSVRLVSACQKRQASRQVTRRLHVTSPVLGIHRWSPPASAPPRGIGVK